MAPVNDSPFSPLSSVTASDRVRMKSSGWFWMSAHSMPMALMWTGSHSGHLKLLPVAELMVRKIPKPGFVLKLPSPRKAKLRASPPSSNEPIFTRAPIDWNEISS